LRILKGKIKELQEQDIRMLREWKGCLVSDLYVQGNHIHLVVSIPPKVPVSKLKGILKGK